MRIAMIFRKLNTIGGSQRHALNIAAKLKEMGHEVTLYATQKGEGGFIDLIHKFRVIYLETYHAPVYYVGNPFKQIYSLFANMYNEQKDAYALACLIDPNTEILNPHHDPITYKVAYYFKKYVRNIPSVWTMNDLTTRNFLYMRESEVNPDWKPSRIKQLVNWAADIYEIKRFISSQDGISVLDRRDERWTKKYLGKESTIVRSALGVQNFPYQQRDGGIDQNNGVKLLASGIFFNHRRFEDIIEAMVLLKGRGIVCSLDIIGAYEKDDAYYRKIDALVHTRHMQEYVKFLGTVGEADLVANRQRCDIFVFPSHLQSWGIAVFESMACGTPVIVSRSAGASEVLTDGENALLVKPKAPDEIANAITRLVESPTLYIDLSKNGRKFVEEHMSWEKSTRDMLALFGRVGASYKK